MQGQIAADMAIEEDGRLLQLRPPIGVLTVDEVAYDQSAVPMFVAKHRATTRSHRYVHEVQYAASGSSAFLSEGVRWDGSDRVPLSARNPGIVATDARRI
ncbi:MULTISPECIES: hypothetical protein [unclassified Rhizobium]|uniref:hypothetical protein n=1 Tax=unclassified Rhizobium TaxID=2613769 RepID=UPI000B28BFD4|nr:MULTISPECIES: hypothetical protein [unclassified Rhizobium]